MSKKIITGLKPELVWKYFYEISQVPRPSKKEEKIREYVKEFSVKNNFVCKEDEAGNIVIKVPATEGLEDKPIVVLQGHLDMVCEMNKGTEHDFDKDPIKLLIDDGWMTADGTTLGADNGIGVAAAMAAATDPDVVHGPLELLMTIDEETGMTGVNSLEPGFIKGKVLLNMDSEEDGTFYVGCCGGIDTVGRFKIKWNSPNEEMKPYELMVTGLKGGHSGLDIHRGRANAIKLLGQLLYRMEGIKYRITGMSGGSKRNAIPREAEVTLLIYPEDSKDVKTIIRDFVEDTLLEFQKNDGGLKVVFKRKKTKVKNVYGKKFTKKLIKNILALPHGIIAMSPDIPDLVETSTNLATVSQEGTGLRIGSSQRSSIESAKVNIANTVKVVLDLGGASEIFSGDGYPGWQPNMDSELLKVSQDVYFNMYAKLPEIKAIHAGLECGLLGAKYPGLDMISFGPTIHGAHSPDEKVNIEDVNRFYTLLKNILKVYTA